MKMKYNAKGIGFILKYWCWCFLYWLRVRGRFFIKYFLGEINSKDPHELFRLSGVSSTPFLDLPDMKDELFTS